MSQISIVHAVLSLYANITVNGDQKAITQIVSSPFQVPKADIQSISDGLSRSRHRFSSGKWRLLKRSTSPIIAPDIYHMMMVLLINTALPPMRAGLQKDWQRRGLDWARARGRACPARWLACDKCEG